MAWRNHDCRSRICRPTSWLFSRRARWTSLRIRTCQPLVDERRSPVSSSLRARSDSASSSPVDSARRSDSSLTCSSASAVDSARIVLASAEHDRAAAEQVRERGPQRVDAGPLAQHGRGLRRWAPSPAISYIRADTGWNVAPANRGACSASSAWSASSTCRQPRYWSTLDSANTIGLDALADAREEVQLAQGERRGRVDHEQQRGRATRRPRRPARRAPSRARRRPGCPRWTASPAARPGRRPRRSAAAARRCGSSCAGGHPVDQLVEVDRHRRELAGIAGAGRPVLGVPEHEVGRGGHVGVHRGQPGLAEQRVDQRALAAVGLADDHRGRLAPCAWPGSPRPTWPRPGSDSRDQREQLLAAPARPAWAARAWASRERSLGRLAVDGDDRRRAARSPRSAKPTTSVSATTPSRVSSVVATVPPASWSAGSKRTPSGRSAVTPTPARPSSSRSTTPALRARSSA